MGKACSMLSEGTQCKDQFFGKPKEKRQLGRPRLRRLIIKWILEK
jgi:hypothetical protein